MPNADQVEPGDIRLLRQFLAKLAQADLDGNVKPEIEVFDFGIIHVVVEAF